MAEIPEFTEVQRLSLKSGDILVLHVPDKLSEEQYHQVSAIIRTKLPPGVELMILEPGMSIEVAERA